MFIIYEIPLMFIVFIVLGLLGMDLGPILTFIFFALSIISLVCAIINFSESRNGKDFYRKECENKAVAWIVCLIVSIILLVLTFGKSIHGIQIIQWILGL